MPRAAAGRVELEYETRGRSSDPPLLLIHGFAGQLVHWPRGFLDALVERGFFVVIFDNRDVGLSTKLDDATGNPPYTLADMAADACGVLDAAGIGAAHVLGMSMGGFIAQLMALRSPERVLSLCSLMSTTGDPAVPPPTAAALATLMHPLPDQRELYLAHAVRLARVLGSVALGVDEAGVRERAAAAWDRGLHAPGRVRQLAAIVTAPDRTAALRAVRVPTVVIHGAADPLVSPVGGESTAAAIPGRGWC